MSKHVLLQIEVVAVLTITPHYVKTRTAADNFSQSRFQTSIVLRYIYIGFKYCNGHF